MFARSRIAFAFLIGLAGCVDRLPVPPQSPQSGGLDGDTQLPAPTGLRATSVGAGSGVVISWNDDSRYPITDNARFRIDRSMDDEDWAVLRFTNVNRTGDGASISHRQCYRVTALSLASPSLDSNPSAAICVGSKPRQ